VKAHQLWHPYLGHPGEAYSVPVARREIITWLQLHACVGGALVLSKSCSQQALADRHIWTATPFVFFVTVVRRPIYHVITMPLRFFVACVVFLQLPILCQLSCKLAAEAAAKQQEKHSLVSVWEDHEMKEGETTAAAWQDAAALNLQNS
jgi:hypothetical protein